jgi:hypothetical protein
LRIESTSEEVTNSMLLSIRSLKSNGSQGKEHSNKLNEVSLYYYLFIRQVSQMEFFYLYQSEVGVHCAFAFREAFV